MSRGSSEQFFDEQLDQSRVKGEIVAKYFWAWAKNAVKNYSSKHNDQIVYLDLFCGRGDYTDGSPSTPLLVMERIMADADFVRWVHPIFNDSNPKHIEHLKNLIASIPDVEEMGYYPSFATEKVGPHFTELFSARTCPTLTFLDPLGYKALSRNLIAATTKHWHCDGVFFFNYARINRALSSMVLRKVTYPLFGKERAERLAPMLLEKSPREREDLIIREFTEALQDVGVVHPLFFQVRHRSRNETSHYLVFTCKHGLGHHLMKDVMARYSSTHEGGVPGYTFDPMTEKQRLLPTQLDFGALLGEQDDLFTVEPIGRIDELASDLLNEFTGQTIDVANIYKSHQFGTPYIKANYKQVLLRLEESGKVTMEPSAPHRPKRQGKLTLGDSVVVTFPRV